MTLEMGAQTQQMSEYGRKKLVNDVFVYLLCTLQFASYGAVLILQSSIDVTFTTGIFCLVATYVGGSAFSLVFQPSTIKQDELKRVLITSGLTYLLFVLAHCFPGWYSLIPASFISGAGEACFWPCSVILSNQFSKSFDKRRSNVSYIKKMSTFVLSGISVSLILGNVLNLLVPRKSFSSSSNIGYQNVCHASNCETEAAIDLPVSESLVLFASIVIMARLVFIAMALCYCEEINISYENTEKTETKRSIRSEEQDVAEDSSNVILKVGGVKFECNRFVLSSVSGYFRTMFGNRSFIENESSIVEIKGPYGEEITSKTMHEILSYAYTNHIDLTDENVYDISIAADYLEMEDLQMKCINHLKKVITYQSWTSIFRFASQLCLNQVKSSCMNEFQKVYNSLDFSQYQLSEIKDILKAQQKKMVSKGVFDAVLSWVKVHADERKRHCAELLKFVDFKTMDTEYVSEKVCNEEVLAEDPNIVRDICQTLANRRLLIVGGLTGKTERNCVKYCPTKKEFAGCQDAPNLCHASSFAAYGNKVIVAGGTGNIYDIQTYDVDSNSWILQKNVLPVPRCNAAAVVLNDKLYFIGGYDFSSKNRLRTIDTFNIDENGSFSPETDLTLPSLKDARTDHAIVSRGDEIYICAGYGGYAEGVTKTGNYENTYIKTCEVVNTVTKERYNIANLKEGRQQPAAVIFDDQLLVIGGKAGMYDKLASVESYSFDTRQWTAFPPMNVARYGHCACVHDGKVFVIGGNRTKSIESYNPLTKSWTLHQEIKVPRWGSSVAQVVSNNTDFIKPGQIGRSL